ncbi:CHAT domain-containing protein [Streptomyces sp. NPDC006134]|uniref:CHAT domain-containing protein n=1 Tax=Streptomyces sp. NPDC006134 TaxID=3154467 RepID=UPI0033CC6450
MGDDLVVFVPGLFGNELLDPSGRPVWAMDRRTALSVSTGRAAHWMNLPQGLGDRHPGDGLRPGRLLRAPARTAALTGTPYALLRERLEKQCGTAVRYFTYDWRLSHRLSAHLLARAVDRWLTGWRGRGHPGARVVLVCETEGGLVGRYFAEVLGGRDVLRALITVGTPHLGTPKALALVLGTGQGHPGARNPPPPMASWPSLHQTLPVYPCVHGDGKLLRLGEAALPGLPAGAVADADRFHGEIAARPGSASGPAHRFHIIAGTLQPTAESVVLAYGRAFFRQEETRAGDGSTPLVSAVPAHCRGKAEVTLLPGRRHELLSNAAVLGEITRVLRAEHGPGGVPAAGGVGLGLPGRVPARQTVPVAAVSARADAFLRVRVTEPHSEAVRWESVLVRHDPAGPLEGNLRFPDKGTWRVRVESYVPGEAVPLAEVLVEAVSRRALARAQRRVGRLSLELGLDFGVDGLPAPSEPGRAPFMRPGQPPFARPGQPPSPQPGQPLLPQPGQPPSVQPGQPPSVQPGQPPSVQPGQPLPQPGQAFPPPPGQAMPQPASPAPVHDAGSRARVWSATGAPDGPLAGRGADHTVPQGAAAPPEERRLVAELAEQAAPGREVPLHVQVTRGTDGAGAPLRPFTVPPQGARLHITVHAPGLVALGDLQQELTVPPGRDSDVVRFGLRTAATGLHRVTARAFRGGTFLGEVHCQISVEDGGPTRDGRTRTALLPSMAFEPGEVTLQVLEKDRRTGTYTFQLLSANCHPPEVFSFRSGDPREAARQIFGELKRAARAVADGDRDADRARLRRRLRSHGVQLWTSAVPEAVQHQFWEEADRITAFTVLGEHDIVPWELLYPLNEGREDRGFLAEWLPVVRRVFDQERVGSLSLPGAAFVVPPGSPADAHDEVEALRASLGAGAVDAGVLTEGDALRELIEGGYAGVLHFACHNTFGSAGSWVQMADGAFDPIDLAAAAQLRSLRPYSPLVFFNACRSAGEIDWFGTSLGWAPQFLQAGAGAFVGTLWPVRSQSALMFADAFYRQLIVAGQPLGQASLAARKAISDQDGDPTWLAYAVYGSPAATARPAAFDSTDSDL